MSLDGLEVRTRVVDGATYETVVTATDEIRLRVVDGGGVQVAEYESEDRAGSPVHVHPWHEVEYVVDGTVEFFVAGAWTRCGPGSVQLLPAGVPHAVRVPDGRARVLMVTIGAPYDGFARDLAALARTSGAGPAEVAAAGRHGVHLAP